MPLMTSLSPDTIGQYCRECNIVPHIDAMPVTHEKNVIVVSSLRFNTVLPKMLQGDLSLIYCLSDVLAREIGDTVNQRTEIVKYIRKGRNHEERLNWPDPIAVTIRQLVKDQIISWYNTFLYTLPNSARPKLKKTILDIFHGRAAPEEIMSIVKSTYKGSQEAASLLIDFLARDGKFYVGILNCKEPIRKEGHPGMTPFEYHYFIKMAAG